MFDYYIFGETPKEDDRRLRPRSVMTCRIGFRSRSARVGPRSSSRNENVYTTYPVLGLQLLQNDEVTADKTTGKVSINYKIDDNNFLYGFVATGFKMGGLNAPNFYVPASSFGPEDVVDYELGAGSRRCSAVGSAPSWAPIT